ncbi:uncharacterized protein MONBRDRAFT_27585 [Monosiga brevicollis MX1]|uniref:protein O-GlcNAc transferase n=1 Tax=Monosiga brevicollis TaxID=81824 RepID=A9V5Q3_MONBE|nr:uncharacterized protein MONBRDRAFT_27585 [Monosiga brevicollis MX1]EDQ87082.1 predicted protein [Monosiga brevicollis MX1]|eukprot:XP_001748025.1 hypothetical protein [Monosiga brevicollis MX1]
MAAIHFACENYDRALELNQRASQKTDPANAHFAQGYTEMAAQYVQTHHMTKAEHAYRCALAINPSLYSVRNDLGNLLKATGKNAEARQCYEQVLYYQPTFAVAWNNLGCIELDEQQPQHALQRFTKAVYLDSQLECVYSNLLSILGAESTAAALGNVANVLRDEGQLLAAQHVYKRSLGLSPSAHVHAGLAALFHRSQQLPEAARHYQEAIKLNPSFQECYSNLGHVMRDLGDLNSARVAFQQAVRLKASADDFNNLACVCKDLGVIDEAIKYYQSSLELKSDNPNVFCNLAHSLQMVCDWTNYQERMQQLVALVQYQIDNNQFPSVHPHHTFLYPLPNTLRKAIAAAHAHAAQRNIVQYNKPAYDHSRLLPLSGRLRVGYVSSDFKDHPTSHLMQSIPGYHNREQFEIFCYSLAPDDGSIYRRKIEAEVEHFVDLSGIPDHAIAADRIYHDGIHILINLNGYTKGARTEIFALRPAPIQAMWLGYPGSSGADFMDYIITDEQTSPPEHWRDAYSEHFVYMPCFFVGDHMNMFPLPPRYNYVEGDDEGQAQGTAAKVARSETTSRAVVHSSHPSTAELDAPRTRKLAASARPTGYHNPTGATSMPPPQTHTSLQVMQSQQQQQQLQQQPQQSAHLSLNPMAAAPSAQQQQQLQHQQQMFVSALTAAAATNATAAANAMANGASIKSEPDHASMLAASINQVLLQPNLSHMDPRLGPMAMVNSALPIPYVQTNYLIPNAHGFPTAMIPAIPFSPQFGMVPTQPLMPASASPGSLLSSPLAHFLSQPPNRSLSMLHAMGAAAQGGAPMGGAGPMAVHAPMPGVMPGNPHQQLSAPHMMAFQPGQKQPNPYMMYMQPSHPLPVATNGYCAPYAPPHAPLPPPGQEATQPMLHRRFYGLPEDKVIFCNFNQLYKIDPLMFDTWLNILKRVPNSVLWILRFPPAGEQNLQKRIIEAGLTLDRVIFSPVAGKIEHVRRGALADICLDTHVCNGHTTGMDILWAGTPMISLPGDTLASRVASSLLKTLGCPELIARSHEDYVNLAVQYASNPQALRNLKRKVRIARKRSPLFNTRLLTRNLERAFKAMWYQHERFGHPAHLNVAGDAATSSSVGGASGHVPTSKSTAVIRNQRPMQEARPPETAAGPLACHDGATLRATSHASQGMAVHSSYQQGMPAMS